MSRGVNGCPGMVWMNGQVGIVLIILLRRSTCTRRLLMVDKVLYYPAAIVIGSLIFVE
jgi:hypothetical protein